MPTSQRKAKLRSITRAADIRTAPVRAKEDKGRAARRPTPSTGKIVLSAEKLSGPGIAQPQPADTLIAVSKAVGSHLELSEILRQTTGELARALRADVGSVWRIDDRARELRPIGDEHALAGLAPAAVSSLIESNQWLRELISTLDGPLYSDDSANDARFAGSLFDVIPHRSVLVQPLRLSGRIAGMMVFLWTRERHQFTDVELRLVDAATQQAGIVIENAELLAEIAALNLQLERRVRDRTSRLKRAYEELRASRAELRARATHLERVRERERARIAHEIHDEVGQALTGLKMEVARVARGNDGDLDVNRLSTGLDDMLRTVQRIAAELRPSILDDLGLVAALEWQVQEFEARTGVKCRLRCTGSPADIDSDRSIALFRIFKESLTNVARHAQATRVQALLAIGGTSVRLDISDNGKGISRDPLPRHRSLGLIGMQDRASAFGGEVSVTAAPQGGTVVRARLPLARRPPARRVQS